jgi:hypothetical protein
MTSLRLRTTLAALMALALLPAAAAAEPVGFVAAVRGFAEMGSDEGSLAMAVLDRDVAVGDVVRTRDGGWIKMLLADDTTLALDSRSELHLERFGGSDGTAVRLSAGHVRTKLVDGFGKRPHLVMTTPHARIDARASEWLTWLEADATWVCAVSGEVDLRAGAASAASGTGGTGGASLELGPGDCARAADTLQKASRPRRLQAVAMRPGAVRDRRAFPAKPELPGTGAAVRPASALGSDPLVIDVNDLLRRPDAEQAPDGRPPASAAIP